jgi:ubiquinone/menaquinone biosynthesis C-methylase UbiE/Skp family chaperone for outer membrane proteins
MGFQNGGCDLPFTGERVVPGKTPALLVLEHIIRYRFAARFADGARVLDAACGTGYGSSILAKKAKSVIGIDNSLETIRYARQNYSHRNLHYSIADFRLLPFHAGGFDLAVMFEAIEHIAEQEQCIIEIRRILDSKGILILSTPNATRPMKAVEEHNPFHSKELTDQEFLELLRRHFPHVQLLYQHEFSASAIQNTCGPTTELAEVVEDSTNAAGAKYFIAVCGAQPIKVSLTRTLGVVGIDHQIEIVQELRQSQNQIEALKRQRDQNDREYSQSLAMHQQDLQAKQEAIEALLRQREENDREFSQSLAMHKQELDAKQEAVEALLHQREENEREYAKNLAAHAEVISNLDRDLQAVRMELKWLYRWMPTNQLARKLFYGKNLRKRVLHALGLKS